MEWIVEGLTRPIAEGLQRCERRSRHPGTPFNSKAGSSLFLGGLGRLVGGVDLLCEAGEDGLYFTGIQASRSQSRYFWYASRQPGGGIIFCVFGSTVVLAMRPLPLR